ncbi:MAG: hypothetical protein JWN48_4194 [Myxococcaceae bacterium]|nr:hypothetical protein [Myxococcaceae bacterium]
MRFPDIHGLRAKLPRHWWTEVSRVRALIDSDAESGLFELGMFEHAAKALHRTEEALAREHAAQLFAASRKLAAIAQAQVARA